VKESSDMTIIETNRLILRLLELNDLDEMLKIWGNAEVMKYCGSAGTREEEMKSIQFYINMQKNKGFSPYVVVLKESGDVAGVCGFNPPDNGCDAELMYHFKVKYWGNGYATEAARACVEYIAKSRIINVLGASIEPENISSEKVLLKLGFRYIGEKWSEAANQKYLYYNKSLR